MSLLGRHARKHMLAAVVVLYMFLRSLYKQVYHQGAGWERGVKHAAGFALLWVVLWGVCLLFLHLVRPLRQQYEEDQLNG